MRILLVGDSTTVISGFGTALRNLATTLHNVGHTVAHLGWQTMGQERIATFHDKILGYTELPNITGERFGENAFKFWLVKWKPDLVIVLSDFWMMAYMFKMELPVPLMMWYPIDGYPITEQMEQMLKLLDYRVCISKYGANMVMEKGIETYYVPHGVNTANYYPRPPDEILEMKRTIGIPDDAFVIGRVDRNQPRKKIPRTIRAFAKIHKDYPETVLYLHMDKRDKEGSDLDFIVKRFGLTIGKDVFFPPPDMMANFMYGLSEDTLAKVMSMIDIHLWTTGGEGFGLTGLETMACGAVNVATDYTTPPELFNFRKPNKAGLPIKVETFEANRAGVDRAFIDVDDAYEKVKWLLENRDEMKVMAENGVKRAKEVYDWNIVTRQFDDIVRNIDIWRI